MKTKKNSQINYQVILVSLMFLIALDAIAQGPPPPPGVPLDFAIFLLVASCIGYGVKRLYDSKK